MASTCQILEQNFFARPALVVARELLGKYLVRRWKSKETAAVINEVEAYVGPHDLASHGGLDARRGQRSCSDRRDIGMCICVTGSTGC